jgi:hypothetical protein
MDWRRLPWTPDGASRRAGQQNGPAHHPRSGRSVRRAVLRPLGNAYGLSELCPDGQAESGRLRCHNRQSRIVSGMRVSQASRASRPIAANPVPPLPDCRLACPASRKLSFAGAKEMSGMVLRKNYG